MVSHLDNSPPYLESTLTVLYGICNPFASFSFKACSCERQIHNLIMPVPNVPLKLFVYPAYSSPASRPCLFAVVFQLEYDHEFLYNVIMCRTITSCIYVLHIRFCIYAFTSIALYDLYVYSFLQENQYRLSLTPTDTRTRSALYVPLSVSTASTRSFPLNAFTFSFVKFQYDVYLLLYVYTPPYPHHKSYQYDHFAQSFLLFLPSSTNVSAISSPIAPPPIIVTSSLYSFLAFLICAQHRDCF